MIRPALPAFRTLGGKFGKVLLTCEHASNWVPDPWCPIDQSANQSINQSINQSTNQSVKQPNQTKKLPEARFPHRMTASDQSINQQHWGIDIGAASLVQSINQSIDCPSLLATISRLVIDVNRPLTSPTLIRTMADNQPIEFNQSIDRPFTENDLLDLTPEKDRPTNQSIDESNQPIIHSLNQSISQFLDQIDRDVRVDEIYVPYHQQLFQLVNQYKPRLILSIHSFTPLYEGQPRSMEIGVLFNPSIYQSINQSTNQSNVQSINASALPAQRLNDLLIKAGFDSRINEPWSGIDGYMYAVESVSNQSTNHSVNQSEKQSINQSITRSLHQIIGRPNNWVSPIECTLMIEVRQDLAVQPEWRERVTKAIVQFINQSVD